jgi:hypothetical protein
MKQRYCVVATGRLSRQQWLLASVPLIRDLCPVQGGTVYLSKITLYTASFPIQLLHLVERGEYVMHQWLWQFFPVQSSGSFFIGVRSFRGRFVFCAFTAAAGKRRFLDGVRPFEPVLSPITFAF